jgi:serine/threonine protein kinase
LPKKPKGGGVKELHRELLCRTNGIGALGSGTFGTCFFGKYGGIPVAVKELKDGKDSKKPLKQLQKAVHREAQVLSELGDHKGLPFLFGICSERKPVCLVLLFHGNGTSSLTIYKATKTDPQLTKAEWNCIFNLMVDTLNYIHTKGYIHNDLKANNVVLEGPRGSYNPVIIDFGNCVRAADAKPRFPMAKYLRDIDSYIAPEILDGTGKPSPSSDIYSFAKMIDFVSKRCNLTLPSLVKSALASNSGMRPSLADLKKEFS